MKVGAYMSQENDGSASAINLSDISAHPAEAIAALVEVVKAQGEQIAHLEENQEIQAGIIAKLKSQLSQEPTAAQQDRGEILRALLAANGGKMLAKEARQKMKLDKATFSRIVSAHREYIEVRPFHANRKNHLLVLRENG
jgi:uncharacterized glyoxalase superfamily protein PhnB